MKSLPEQARQYAEKTATDFLMDVLADDETNHLFILVLIRAFKAGWNARGRKALEDFQLQDQNHSR